MLWLSSSSKLDWGCGIISSAKTASKKSRALICSIKFLFPEAPLYLYKSTIWLCMVYCCHVASWSLFSRYYFGRCSPELVQLVPLSYSRGRSTYYSGRLHNFSFIVPRWYKDVYVNSFFPRTARLWGWLLIECFLWPII